MERLDTTLVQLGLAPSRERAQAMILAGEVWDKETRLEKPGLRVKPAMTVEIRSRAPAFVSRAGEKLQHGLARFQISVQDKICLDIGASTGGFTDCLLKSGARHVFAIDVGYGQLDSKLRQDPRVSVLEKTNARYLTRETLLSHSAMATEIQFAVIDVSFISLSKVMLPLAQEFPELGNWVALFKPQFEVGRENVGRGGRAKTEAVESAMESLDQTLSVGGFRRLAVPESSPLRGKKSGNVEYLIHYVRP